MTPTATFNDIYFGPTAMRLVTFKTTVRGSRVSRFRWVTAEGAEGCITTGFASHGFPSREAAIQAAGRHRYFIEIQA